MKICKCFAIVFCAGFVFFSCVHEPRKIEGAVPARAAVHAAPPERRGSGLDSAAFKDLPGEARAYLERLARAFGDKDTAFLLAQGESQFERELRPGLDDETYLALLYRLGPYAAETPRPAAGIPRLVPEAIDSIEYTHWEEAGPLLEIKARLAGADGEITPCLVMLVWRLSEPKIQGLFP